MKAIIYNQSGQEVWTNLAFGQQCIEVVQGIPQIKLGEEVPLFDSYLEETQAEKLSVWLDKGKRI